MGINTIRDLYMFKTILSGLKTVFSGAKSGITNLISPLGKYVPTFVKKEYSNMMDGMKSISGKIKANYYKGRVSADILGESRITSVSKGIISAATTTKVAKTEIPSLFAVAGSCAPILGGNALGYALGKAIVSKPVGKTISYGKKAITSTYNSVGNLFRV